MVGLSQRYASECARESVAGLPAPANSALTRACQNSGRPQAGHGPVENEPGKGWGEKLIQAEIIAQLVFLIADHPEVAGDR